MFKKLFKRMATALAIIVLLVSTFGGVAGAGSETRAIQDLRLYSSIVLQLQFSDDPVQTFNSLSEKEQDKVKEVIFYHFENIQAIIDANGSDLEIEAYIDNIPQAVLLLMQIDLDYLGLWAQVSAEKYDIMPPWNPADEQALRLQDLLYRIDEFNSFDAEERAIVLDYFGMVDEWFIPDEEEGPTQEDLENAAIERILVLRNLYQNYEFFSQLSDDNKLSLYDLLDFDLEQVLAIDAQFSYLEDLGYSLLVSSDIIRIANVGFLSLEEVMVALENSINMPQLLSKFREFTQLAALFNLEEASRQNSKDAILSDNKTIIDSALDQQLWRETGLDEFSEDALQIQELLYQAYTSYDAYQTAKGLFIAGYSVNDIKLAFFLGAALALDPQDVINSSAQAIVNYALGNGQSLTSNQKSASLSIGDLSEADYADMLLLISFGASVMYLGGMMLSSTPGLPSIEAPFIAYLGESDAVNLSTGAFYYHENILNVPGRNGLDLVLGITYDSSQADLYKPIYDYWYGDNSIISPTMLEELWNIGAGWSFDLPYIYNDTFKNTYNIHIPGKGTFEFNGTPISNVHNWINYPLQDMVLTNFTGYTHGGGSYRTETSQYKLTFKDGSYYYFNSNGQIILHADNFSNTIRYQYALQSTFDSRYLLSNIVDTAGKNYTLTYSAPSGGRLVTITSPDSATYKINLSAVPSHAGRFNLSSVVNQVNLTTSFTYATKAHYFNYFIYYAYNNGTNYTSWLSTVTYPSGVTLNYTTNFAYDYYLGIDEYWQVWRLNSRTYSDSIVTNYLKTDYAYTGVYYSGSSYTSTVTNNLGVKSTYTFNGSHLNTQITTHISSSATAFRTVTNTYHPTYGLVTQRSVTENYYTSYTRVVIETFSYDSKGNLTVYTSPYAGGASSALHQTVYTYDPTYNLPLSKTYMAPGSIPIKEEYTLSNSNRTIGSVTVKENSVQKAYTEYVYDSYGNVSQIKEYANVTSSSVGSVTATTNISYNNGVMPSSISMSGILDADGLSAAGGGTVSESFTYDTLWRMLSHTDGNGNITQYQYDNLGRITKITYPGGSTEIFAYTATTSQHRVTYTDRLGQVYYYDYDKFGNLKTITYGSTVIESNTYDNRGRLTQTQNAPGLSTSYTISYTYDSYDRVLTMTQKNSSGTILYQENYTYYSVLNWNGDYKVVTTVVGETNAPNIETYVTYDRYGNLIAEGYTYGASATYTYDHLNRLTNETSPGVSNTYTYDWAGNVISVKNVNNNTAYMTYDSMGRMTSASNFNGNSVNNITKYTYDSLSRLIKEEVPFEVVGSTLYYSTTKIYYDKNSNIIKTAVSSNAAGSSAAWRITEYTYNNLDLVLSASVSGFTTTYTYNTAGNMLTQKTGTSSTTTYGYDTKGRLNKVTDALGKFETYVYDNNDFTTSKTDRNGNVTAYVYNALGQVISSSVSGPNGSSSITYQYYKTKALKSEANSTLTTTYYYDSAGRLIRVYDSDTTDKVYGYNSLDQLTSFTLARSSVILQSASYTYDSAGRLWQVKDNSVVQATYLYDNNGNRTSLTYANNTSATYTYNLANLVTSVTNKQGGANLSIFTYTYYLDGNQRTKNDLVITTTYTYDAANRLLSEVESGSGAISKSYTYDQYGNRATMTVSGALSYSATYTYNLNNQLTNESKTVGGSTSYTYDNNGNMKTAGSTTYTYNGFDQLTSVTVGSSTINYVYKPDGLRYSKTVVGVATTHLWSGSNIVADVVSGSGTKTYLYGLGLISVKESGVTQFYLFNAHADVVHLTNSSGTVTKSYNYDSFGVEKNPAPSDTNPFRYAGYYFDVETETYYLQARYYKPGIGRFTSADTHWGPGNTIYGSNPRVINNTDDALNVYTIAPNFNAIKQGSNLYAYCGNNPLRYTDPTGEFWHIIAGAAIGFAISVVTQALSGEGINWGQVAFDTALGALTATGAGAVIGAAAKIGGSIAKVAVQTVEKASSKLLAKAMVTAGKAVPEFKHAAHHIVAGSAKGAEKARDILQKFGVGINDAVNGVFLPTVKGASKAAYHPSVHTAKYYQQVNKMLRDAKNKDGVIRILNKISDQLSSGTFPI